MSELRSREVGMRMISLGFGLRDGGGWVYASIQGVFADGNGRVKGFGIEILEVSGITRPSHWMWYVFARPRAFEYLVWRSCNQEKELVLDPSMPT